MTAGAEVLETVRAVLSGGGNLEASARALFVHPNTVRYRLKRAAELTGLSVTDPRGSWTLQVALALADLDAQHTRALELGARLLLDRRADPDEPLYVYADPAGHPFCIFVG